MRTGQMAVDTASNGARISYYFTRGRESSGGINQKSSQSPRQRATVVIVPVKK